MIIAVAMDETCPPGSQSLNSHNMCQFRQTAGEARVLQRFQHTEILMTPPRSEILLAILVLMRYCTSCLPRFDT